MNETIFKRTGRIIFSLSMVLLLILMGEAWLSSANGVNSIQESQLKKSKMDREIYPLLNDTDLYCSFRILEQDTPDIRIVGAEREEEKSLLSDGDVIYINKGKQDGLEPGFVFLILDIEKEAPGMGPIAFKKGRARIVALSDSQSTAVVEKSCGGTRIGHFLVPFEPKESIVGKDLGFDIPPFEVEGTKGEFIYLEAGTLQIGTGQWALINVGTENGIQIGQQLIVYRKVKADAPIQIIGNLVVIDAQNTTSTVKILSCRDAIIIGDLVMIRPTR